MLSKDQIKMLRDLYKNDISLEEEMAYGFVGEYGDMLDVLSAGGYITYHRDNIMHDNGKYVVYVSITDIGKAYLEDIEKQAKQNRKINIFELIKTIASFGAFLISIAAFVLSLCNKK